MKYAELAERVKQLGQGAEYTLSWYDGVYSEADYTIVPLPEGRFTVYRPSGRGENFPDYDADGRERQHSGNSRNDQQWPPEAQWSHGANANSPACPAPQTTKIGRAG